MSKEWKKYTKKPLTVEAYIAEEEEYIDTLEGTMKTNIGDYVIKGVTGELYPCKPDVFEKTYDKLDYYDFKDKTIKEFCNNSSMKEILEMLDDEFDYGVVYYRDDEIVEVSPRGWSDDEYLLEVVNSCYNVGKHHIGRIGCVHYYTINESKYDNNYEIIKLDDD